MSFAELLRLALSRLRTSRVRAALTMLGVIIGVASVVALVGVGQGTTSNITTRLAGLGTNLLTISPTGRGGTTSTNLTLADATAIGQLASVGAVEPEISTTQTIKAGKQSETVPVVGTTWSSSGSPVTISVGAGQGSDKVSGSKENGFSRKASSKATS
jgi:putative ABC transport system permease protein